MAAIHVMGKFPIEEVVSSSYKGFVMEQFHQMLDALTEKLIGRRPIIVAGDFSAWAAEWGADAPTPEDTPSLYVLILAVSVVHGDYTSHMKPIIGSSYSKSPLLHTSWPLKHNLASTVLKPYMVQLRSGSRLTPVAVRPAPGMMMSLKRPVKSVLSPTYPLLKTPHMKRPIIASPHTSYVLNLNLKHKLHSSPPAPKTGGIVFEKLKPLVPQSSGLLTSPKDGAIHTIPAPNLAGSQGNAVHQLQITSFEDNNHLEIDIHKATKPVLPTKSTFAPKPTYAALSTPSITTFRHQTPYLPVTAHQYQVKEEHNNDLTLKDPLSGKKTYFAPDPDPSLPNRTLKPTQDPLSEPSNGKYPPGDLLIQAQNQAQYLSQFNTTPFKQKPFYGIATAAPQPGYGIPLASQPQLQQHILQQTSMLQGMPLSLYNPTYLVTQSNNLFNNHQQQLQTNLFKPETNFLGTVPAPQPAPGNILLNSYSYKHPEPAASAGQILAATQDQLHELQSAVSQIQLNDLQQQQSHDVPTYAQLVGHEQLALHQQQIPQQNQLEQQLQQQLIQQQEKASHNQLTESEIANLLNYGTINLHNNLSPNDYYHYQVDQEQQNAFHPQPQQKQQLSFYELSERQRENEQILAQAQQDLFQQQQQQQQQPSQSPQTTDYLLAFQEHQQAVANALGLGGDAQNSKRATAESETATTPLRIFVPDNESDYPNSVKAQKRMDELNYEYPEDDEAVNPYNTEPSARKNGISRLDADQLEEAPIGDDNTSTVNSTVKLLSGLALGICDLDYLLPSCKFTVEQEVEGKLSLLDLLITRKEDNTLKFSIFRKPTSTDRYITTDSNHFGAQKQAAFHSMAHRLVNIPMEQENFAAERERIQKAAELNGYDKKFVDKIIRKHLRKKQRHDTTTLQPEREEVQRISLPFYPKVTNHIRKVLKRHGFHVVHKSGNALQELLNNQKDKVPPDERSGIYEIPCQDCPAVYIGQTRRKFKIRLKEHRKAVENERPNDSSVALHSICSKHNINWGNAKLLKNVRVFSFDCVGVDVHLYGGPSPDE
ncbi:uncharacterized protein LOC128745687 [Sabethes cyaneus]|uniref:uncharacterized protein LOC128745687 n=1 Tax=Sabethes cyaneus TaxID=53552 RepID=UPI00237D60D5|nr:uncharacterized protein LOC128745687 [Sabethes cyaneus]